jgi:PAS domain S-box-containing protein
MSESDVGDVLVLAVDDEQAFADMTATYLERERPSFTVVTANSAEEGLAVLDDRAVDCVVSDYDMAGEDGLDLLRTVRAEHGDLPFVLFTGKGNEEIASEAISAGVDDYLQKATGSDQYTILANRVENLVHRRRASDAARQSEERYRNLVNTAPTSIAVFDRAGRLLFGNDRAADLMGYDDVAAMEGMRMAEFVHPEDRDRASERFATLIEDGEPVPETEMRLQADDGEVRHVRIASAPGVYEGEPVAQAALMEVAPDDDLVDRALDSLEDVFYVLDTDGSLRHWNERANELTGLDDGELVERDPSEFFVDRDAGEVAAAITEVLETGGASIEADLRRADGETVPYEFRGRLLTGDDGDPVAVAGVGRDVTERRRRERALRALNDIATDITSYTDRQAVCDRTIEAAENVLSFDITVINLEEEGTLPVTAISSGVSPEGATAMSVEEGLAGLAYREGRTVLVDEVEDHPEANPQGPYRSALTVPLGDHGVFQSVAGEPNAFDDTDRELAELLAAHAEAALDRIEREAALQRQNESLEEFATIVSHDLRNPLNVLQSTLDLARETGDPGHLADSQDAIDRMDALIDDLLTLAREGQVVDAVETVSVEEMARSCWETVAPPSASLVVEGGVSVRADPGRLRQALENLLANAVEHGSTSPREDEDAVEHGGEDVTVRVGRLADGPGFYVADDGPGIPVDERDRVFEPGYTTSDDGTGFGLRIVKEVVDAHGWHVAVTAAEAGGARFEVRT